ncbi:MAG: DUF533 domain-containing protein [Candidatus Eisenbacteria bacterium]|uniref:DUF533 domain-containing protein n=1 Tax=Eiseniibacteriota bacterium TaxID=2212470 RepID=A0A956NDS3_UNCEI|nr:DUF533 domain-containing protein [Candidatus Eisenbacteria bacterium]MCB9465019.1 DUF533 domain-containing protein [Candidatus Eisenbacteria bacterium]
MGLFDAEHLIGQLLVSELGGGGGRKRKKRLSKNIRRAALSPQGLTLLGGIAFAAIEHLQGKKAAGSTGPSGFGAGGTGPGGPSPGGTPGALPATASSAATTSVGKSHVPPPPPRPANLPPIPGSRPQAEASEAPQPEAPYAGAGAGEESSSDSSSDASSLLGGADQRGRVLVRAMVEAAKADGEVDPSERARILEQLQAAGADSEARTFVIEQLDRPLDLEGLLAWVGKADPGLAAEVYVASRVVIADETPAESAYLALLAARLGLSEDLVRELRSQVDRALEPAED